MALIHDKKNPWVPLDIAHIPLEDIRSVLSVLAGNTRHILMQRKQANGEISYAFDEQ